MRNDATEKHEFELNVVRLFRKAGGLNAETELLVGANPPDVVAIYGVSNIGIEVRRIFMDETRAGSLDRQRPSTFRDIINYATMLHGQSSNRSIHVSVAFFRDADIRKSEHKHIAKLMVDQVSSLNLDVGQRFNLRSEDLWGSAWPEAVLRIWGFCVEGEGPPCWALTSWSLLGETTDRIIQHALDKKEIEINKWRNEFNQSWIVLVIDGTVSASFVKPHEKMASNVYQSSFDRAFVMEYNGAKFKELLLRRHKETV